MDTEMDIEDRTYKESYEVTIKTLEASRVNKIFDIETIKAELDSLYLYEGLDMEGRGAIKNAEISGAIAGYQVYINNYMKEKRV